MTIREFLGGYSHSRVNIMVLDQYSDILTSGFVYLNDPEDEGFKDIDRIGDRFIQHWFIGSDSGLVITVYGGIRA